MAGNENVSIPFPVSDVALDTLKSALTQISLDPHRSLRELLLGSFEDTNSNIVENQVTVSIGLLMATGQRTALKGRLFQTFLGPDFDQSSPVKVVSILVLGQ